MFALAPSRGGNPLVMFLAELAPKGEVVLDYNAVVLLVLYNYVMGLLIWSKCQHFAVFALLQCALVCCCVPPCINNSPPIQAG